MAQPDQPELEPFKGQNHHILPQEQRIQERTVVLWAKQNGIFDLESPENLVFLPSASVDVTTTSVSGHNGSHPKYSDYILRQLQTLEAEYNDVISGASLEREAQLKTDFVQLIKFSRQSLLGINEDVHWFLNRSDANLLASAPRPAGMSDTAYQSLLTDAVQRSYLQNGIDVDFLSNIYRLSAEKEELLRLEGLWSGAGPSAATRQALLQQTDELLAKLHTAQPDLIAALHANNVARYEGGVLATNLLTQVKAAAADLPHLSTAVALTETVEHSGINALEAWRGADHVLSTLDHVVVGLGAVGAAVTAWTIVTSDDPAAAAVREGAIFVVDLAAFPIGSAFGVQLAELALGAAAGSTLAIGVAVAGGVVFSVIAGIAAEAAIEALHDAGIDIIGMGAEALTAAPGWLAHIVYELGAAAVQVSPLVLDLDGNGLDLTPLAGSHARFDLDLDGMSERVGWVAPSDGLLALDRNSNGRIDNNSELFGNSTTGGFAVLAALDTNHDGVVSAADPTFADLRVWRDLDGDGRSEPGELSSLAAFDIVSLETTSSTSNTMVAGNRVSDVASHTLVDGSTRVLADVWFSRDTVLTQDRRDYVLDAETLLLPKLAGFGQLPDLTIAMSRDPALKSMVKDLAAHDFMWLASTASIPQIDAVLFRWAGVGGVSTTSRGGNVNGQHLAFLEALTSTNWTGRDGRPNPGFDPGTTIEAAFTEAREAFRARLGVQIAGDPFASGSYDPSLDHLTAGSLDQAAIDHLASSAAQSAAPAATWAGIVSLIDEAAGGLLDPGSEAMLNAAIAASVPDSTLLSIRQSLPVHHALNLTGTQAADELHGDLNADVIAGLGGDDRLFGSEGNDNLGGGAGKDLLSGDGGNDSLSGDDGDDQLFGGSGNDRLLGGMGADRLEGGPGDDYLEGYYGNDTYVVGLGHDVVYEVNDGDDTLVWVGASSLAELRFSRAGEAGLMIESLDGSNSVLVSRHFNQSGSNVVEHFQFDNGTTFDPSAMSFTTYGTGAGDTLNGITSGGLPNDTMFAGDGNDQLYGGTGNDNLYGEAGSDMLDGGAGNDLLNGGDGDDRLLGQTGNDRYEVGLGADYVFDNDGNDTVSLPSGVSAWSVVATRTANGLDLQLSWTGGSVTIANQFNSNPVYKIEVIQFADGSIFNVTQQSLTTIGSSSGEAIQGISAGALPNDIIKGGGGNDYLDGGVGDDKLYGELGNDTLVGGSGNDTLSGGLGNDGLDGKDGNDRYFFERDGGHDVITNNDATSNDDRLVLSADVRHDQIWFTRTGDDLIASVVGTTDDVTFRSWFKGAAFQADFIDAGDGYHASAAAVISLQQQMASYSAPSIGTMDLSAPYYDALDSFLASSWLF